MSNDINIFEFISEHWLCSKCGDYLSESVHMTPDGISICKHCTTVQDVEFRQITSFDSILYRISFPCRFKNFGCSKYVTFSQHEHESKCTYKVVPCPVSVVSNCSWNAKSPQMLYHVISAHSELLKYNSVFKLQLNEDAQGMIMLIKDYVPFIIKYSYSAANHNLKYDIRFCASKKEYGVTFQFKLANDLDAEHNIGLKANNCYSYDESFCDDKNAKILNLNKFMEILHNPSCISVTIKLKLVKLPCSKKGNDDSLEYREYKDLMSLFMPYWHANAGSDSKYTLLASAQIFKLIMDVMKSCQWPNCSFVGLNNIKDHERVCQFRLYKCVYNECDKTFRLSAAQSHLQTHDGEFMFGKIMYKTYFSEVYNDSDLYIVRNHEIVLICHSMLQSGCGSFVSHCVDMYTSKDNCLKISGYLEFEHQHCGIKSKRFYMDPDNNLEITLWQLPSCFKIDDELLVTVNLKL